MNQEPLPGSNRADAQAERQAAKPSGDGEWQAPKPLKIVVFEIYFGGTGVLIWLVATFATARQQIDALGLLFMGVLLAITIPLLVVTHYLSEGYEVARKIMCGLAILILLSQLLYLLTFEEMRELRAGIGAMMPAALTLLLLNLPETKRYCNR